MKNKIYEAKNYLAEKLRPIFRRIKRFFVCEMEIGGERIEGLEYRNIGIASATAGTLGVLALALCSGLSLRGALEWMGFLPREAAGAVLHSGEERPGERPPAESPKRSAARAESFAALEIVQSNSDSPSSRLDRGAFLLGLLMNRIVSEQDNTPVLVKLPQGASSHGKVIIPPGSLIIGSTQGKSERRIFVSFHTLRTPEGAARPIKAQLLSPDGSAGLTGDYSSGRGKAVAGAAISAFVAGASAGLMTFQAGPLGAVTEGSLRNSMLSGIAGTANFAADTFTQDMRNAPGVTKTEPDTPVLVMLDEDFSLEEERK